MDRLILEENKVGRDFIIGDLHGQKQLLLNKMSEVQFDEKKDRILSVGDLIDRGVDSLGCLDLLNQPWFYCVTGNHERMMVDAMRGNNEAHWYNNGGDWVLDGDSFDKALPFVSMLEKLPLSMQVEYKGLKIGIVHAEPAKDWESEFIEENAIWSRSKISSEDDSEIKNVDWVFVGHTPVKVPVSLGNVIYIDTGAVFYGNLTMVNLDVFLTMQES